MKPILKLLYCICICALFAYGKGSLSLGNEVKEYDKIFEKISETRIGIDDAKLDKLDNPFVVGPALGTDSNGTTTLSPSYDLEATLDRKAKINGKWYTIKDEVEIYKLVKINHNSVILENESEKKEIFIRTKDETNIKIFSK